MSDDKFDCIIVGTGPAGNTAAYELARQGLQVVLVEKGDKPGNKNMTGGRLYCHSLQQIIPNFWEEAPVERRVEKEELSFLTKRGALTISLDNEALGEAPNSSYVVLRADFDAWLARKAEEAGAMIITGIRVDDLLWSGDKVCGIKAGEDEIFSDVVIAADGVNSLLAQKAGLRGELLPEHVAVGAKSVIALPQKTIEDRFCLRENEGAARLFVGECTKGVPGGGFLYTNKKSVSLGLVFNLHSLVKAGVCVAEAVEEFKFHPAIRPLIEGGEVVEYSAHLVPEAGLAMKPRLFTGGMLVAGDAAGFVLNIGFIVRGMDLAVTSGALAAKTVIAAKEKGDFSADTLKIFEDFIRQSHVYRDLEAYKNVPAFLEEPDIYTTFPTLSVDILTDFFKVEGNPPERVRKMVMRHLNQKKSFWKLAKVGWKGARSI